MDSSQAALREVASWAAADKMSKSPKKCNYVKPHCICFKKRLESIFFWPFFSSKKLAERYLSTKEKTSKTKQLWCDLYIYDGGIIWFSLHYFPHFLQHCGKCWGKYCWIGRCEAITRCTMYLVVGTWPRWTQCCWGPIAYKMLLPLIFQFYL